VLPKRNRVAHLVPSFNGCGLFAATLDDLTTHSPWLSSPHPKSPDVVNVPVSRLPPPKPPEPLDCIAVPTSPLERPILNPIIMPLNPPYSDCHTMDATWMTNSTLSLNQLQHVQHPTNSGFTTIEELMVLQSNLTSHARSDVSKFLLVLVPCYTAISILSDGVVFGYGTRKSIEATNTRTLFATHYVFDEMTLSGTCSFSIINWSLDFKQWDPGTINSPWDGCPVKTVRVILLEDNTEFEGNGEWLHKPHGPSYNYLIENCYECYALLSSCFNYKPPNISVCSRHLIELLYVDEYPHYVALKHDASLLKSTWSSCKDACLRNCSCLVLFCENGTARCFDLYHIGSFQHVKGITGAMSLRYMKLLPAVVVTCAFDSTVLVQNTFTYFELSYSNRSYSVIELLGSDFKRVSYTCQQYIENQMVVKKLYIQFFNIHGSNRQVEIGVLQIVVNCPGQGWIHWQALMHLSLARYSLPNNILGLPHLLCSQGFGKYSQKNHIVGCLHGKWTLSIFLVNVSVVESYSLLILIVKEANAFICELPIFQQVEFKQSDPGGECSLGECSLVYVEVQNLLVYAGSDVNDLIEILEEFYVVFYPDQVGLARLLTEVTMNYTLSLLADWLYESCKFVSLSTFEYIGFQDFLYEASTCSLKWYHLPYEDNRWKVISLVLFNNKESNTVSIWVVCIFNVLKWLVGILQLATSISKTINDHEQYSNLVLKKHVQEHIYFEGNSLVVTMITGCLVHKKGSLQFAQWDPGGFCSVHWKASLNLEAYYFTTNCLSFNLEDKVDFNGGSNVMIQN
jgi:hypothetical protein